MELSKLSRIDLSYPGISYHHFSRGLRVYLDNLEEFIMHAGSQYQLRSQHLIEDRGDEIDEAAYMQEINFIEDVAQKEIPGYVRMSAIMLLWGMFEAMVVDVARYVAKKEGMSRQLSDMRGKSFPWRARKYYERELQIDSLWKDKQCQEASTLKLIRDKIAHRNGKFWDVSESELEKFAKRISNVDGVDIKGSQLFISREYLNSSAMLVFDMLKCLNNTVCSRYSDLDLCKW